jgi:large subunit ribosomal protein L21
MTTMISNYAIVATGGKQYKVCAGDIIEVEKLPGVGGDKIMLDALLLHKNGQIDSAPGGKVSAQILSQIRDRKIVVYKYKAKKNVRRKAGHRQPHTRIQITSI